MAMNWHAQRNAIAHVLRVAGNVAPEIEARWVTEFVSGAKGGEWIAISTTLVSDEQRQRCDAIVARRVLGEPLQYALGEWSFRDFDVAVDARVLIPRPETEWVVEVGLREAQRVDLREAQRVDLREAQRVDLREAQRVDLRGAQRVDLREAHVADLGTGSGVIAIALAAALPDATVWAVDRSADALVVARANAATNGATRVRTLLGDWFDAFPSTMHNSFSLIVSNPPYISEGEFSLLESEVRDHEPIGALVSGPSGLEAIEALLRGAPRWLLPSAALVCEIAPHQDGAAIEIGLATGAYESVVVYNDLAGRPRVLVARGVAA